MARMTQWIAATALAAVTFGGIVACEPADDRAARREGYDDQQLVSEVQREMAAAGDVPPAAVAVRSIDGVVTLSGEVTSEEQRRRAEAVAKEVAGVRSVDNQIAIAGRGARPE